MKVFEMSYDSTEDTKKHIENVRGFLGDVQGDLAARSLLHDASKLEEPEKSMYDEFTPKLRDLTYGSDEYKETLKAMGPALRHHYEVNTHHPEHFKMWRCPLCESVFREEDTRIDFEPETRLCPKCCAHSAIFEASLERTSGIYGMSLLDLIEMLADWKAAGMRHASGNIAQSMEINRKRFGISDQLYEIFMNTIKELGW